MAYSITKNNVLNTWIQEVANMCQPKDIYWCDGSKEEYNHLMQQMVTSGMAIPLKKRPNSFLFRSDPSDVARVENRTFISTPSQDDAGPTNNWVDPRIFKTHYARFVSRLYARTHYVCNSFFYGTAWLAHGQNWRTK